MTIRRVEIKDFLVFKGDFAVDFCSGVNVIIGANGTGKTTLLKAMYGVINDKLPKCFYAKSKADDVTYGKGRIDLFYGTQSCLSFQQRGQTELADTVQEAAYSKYSSNRNCYEKQSVYIPEKDMLSHSPGMLALMRERQAVPFDDTLIDILAKAQLYPKKKAADNPLYENIRNIIGGYVAYEDDEFVVYKDYSQIRVPYSMEASGYKKIGLLWKLIQNGTLEKESVLFWDEPENSINPENIPILVDILLGLSRDGVQVFVATHSELLASYFYVNKQRNDEVMFYSLFMDSERVLSDANDRFDLLNQNKLSDEPVKLYEKRLDKVLGNE